MILYFSGTGNSKYVAERIGSIIGDNVIDLFDRIRERDYSELQSEKPWIVVAPVYAWQLPWIVEEYLQQTELTGNVRIYYILTCGSSIAGAGIYAHKLSKSMGKHYMGCAPVVMPENYIAMFPVPDKTKAELIIDDAEEDINDIAERIMEGRTFKAKQGSRFMSKFINWFFYRFAVKDKKFYVKPSCTGCGRCAKVCPLKNIEIKEGIPHWRGNCTHCMRCICLCPKESIEYGKASVGKWRYQCPK